MNGHVANASAVRRTVLWLPLLAAAGLIFLAPRIGHANGTTTTIYQSAPLVMSGDRFGDLQIPANYDLYPGGLTDSGQIVFTAGTIAGGRPEMLLQWDGKTVSTIVAPASGPAGAYAGDVYWPKDVTIDRPVGMNRRGDIVFSVDHQYGYQPWGTFLWNVATQHVVPIALKQMPATGSLTFVKPGSYGPAINNSSEIAFVGQVRGPSGPNGWGLFLQAADGGLRAICLPEQALPSADGRARAATDPYFMPSLNDTGAVAFVTRPAGSTRHNAYVWQNGSMDALLLVGQKVEGGAKITDVASASLNDHDGSALVAAITDQGGTSHFGLYRVQNGQVRAEVPPGAAMPGGGVLRTVEYSYAQDDGQPVIGLSAANAAGQYVLLASLMDGSEAAYRLDPSGALTSVFQTVPTETVHIQEVGANMRFVTACRPSLNNKGQIVLSVRLAGGHSMIVLLSPIHP